MFGNIDDQDYIIKRLGAEARKNLGIDLPFTDQSKLTTKAQNPSLRAEDTLDKEIVRTDRKYERPPTDQIIQLKPVEELQSTAYNLDKAKFYGIKPDEDKTFKKNSAEFYTGSGNPARIPPKDILTKRRSTVANTGHAIMKSPSHGSLPRVEEKAYNPITGEFVDGSADMANKSYLRGRNNMNANINRAQALKGVKSKDNSSQPSYGSGLMKKKEIFGINSSTLNLGVRASNDSSHGIATRSLTLAPSTFKKPNEVFNRSIKFQRESDRYADASNEKAFGVINDQGYHRKTDLSKLTYNSISGKYYTFA